VSGSYDKTVRVWDAMTGAALQTLEGHSNSVNSVTFSQDNKVEPALFVANDWLVEGGQIFSGFLLIISRFVQLSGTQSLY
jgi:WD40 repeat protein